MIRAAVLEDKVAVITLLRHSREAAGFGHADGTTGFTFPFEAAYAEALFLGHLRPHHLCLVLDHGGAVYGVLMAVAHEHPFGPVRMARETVWWIEPEHRGVDAWRMLDWYEDWAVAENCDFVGMAGMGADPNVGKLYLRRGYHAAEVHYLKAL